MLDAARFVADAEKAQIRAEMARSRLIMARSRLAECRELFAASQPAPPTGGLPNHEPSAQAAPTSDPASSDRG